MALVPKYCDDNKSLRFADLCDGTRAWEIPVKDLTSVKMPSRKHAYILSNGIVYVLDYEGARFIPLNAGDSEGQPTQVSNQDGYVVLEGSGTYNVKINLNEELLIKLIQTTELDYENLLNKPRINNVVITGNRSAADYGLQAKMQAISETAIDEICS